MKKTEPYLVSVSGRKNFYIQHGEKRLSTRESSRSAAHRALQRYLDELKHAGKIPENEVETIGQALDHWRERREGKLTISGSWQKKWRYIYENIKLRSGDIELSTITFRFSSEYAKMRILQGVGAESIRQELSLIRTAWRMSYADNLCATPPAAYDLPAAPPKRDDYFTKEEADRILSSCETDRIKLFCLIGFRTGARPGSILALSWEQVDLDGMKIDFRPRDKKGRVLDRGSKKYAITPISEKTRDELSRLKGEHTTGPVIRSSRGYRVTELRKEFAETLIKAGIKRKMTPHFMRHSVITWKAQAGHDFFKIAGFVGHSSPTMLEKVYGHHGPEYMRSLLDDE